MSRSGSAAHRRSFAVIVLSAAALAASGCVNIVQATREYSFTAPWDNYEKVIVQSRNGGVELSPASDPELRVSGRKWASGATIGEAEANVEQLEVIAEPARDDPRSIVVRLEYPEELEHRSIGAKMVVRVPQPIAASVETSNGSIRVKRMKEPVVLETSNGRITAEDIAGRLEARTSNGRIEARKVAGGVTAETSNGSVVLGDVQGGCRIDTSNGSIRAEAVHGDVEATTSNGTITVAAVPDKSGRVVLRTTNGSIEASIPATLAADIELTTSNGKIRPELHEVPIVLRHMSKRRFEATLNGGGGKVIASTSNGSVTLECR
jgi:hypothetical protein